MMKTVKSHIRGSVFEVTLTRAEKRNSFNVEMIEELTRVFTQLPAVRSVLLKGEGSSFCAGADLDWMQSMKNFSLSENLAEAEKMRLMFQAIRDCPVPIIAEVHGHIMGGGLGLIAVCDFVAAHTSSQFCFSEVKLGLVPAVISPFVAGKVGLVSVRRWMLTGETFSAEEAKSIGFVDFIGDANETHKWVDATATLFNGRGPEAVKDTKYILNHLPQWTESQKATETTRVISQRRVSAEGQEGLSAFFEKRKPQWHL